MIGECCRRGNNGELLTIDHFLYLVLLHNYGRSGPVSLLREGWFDITPEQCSFGREVADDRRRNSDVSKTSG
jgi:hypothetical protein